MTHSFRPAVDVESDKLYPDGQHIEHDRLTIIIPTFCEAENLRELIPRWMSIVHEAGIEADIVVVDDASPDDTQAVCE